MWRQYRKVNPLISAATPTSPATTRRSPPPPEVSLTSDVRGAVVAGAAVVVVDEAVVVERASVVAVSWPGSAVDEVGATEVVVRGRVVEVTGRVVVVVTGARVVTVVGALLVELVTGALLEVDSDEVACEDGVVAPGAACDAPPSAPTIVVMSAASATRPSTTTRATALRGAGAKDMVGCRLPPVLRWPPPRGSIRFNGRTARTSTSCGPRPSPGAAAHGSGGSGRRGPGRP
ncbi:MAG: hypothetical protein R2726_01515 [Acidimicrobiales bacterium]